MLPDFLFLFFKINVKGAFQILHYRSVLEPDEEQTIFILGVSHIQG